MLTNQVCTPLYVVLSHQPNDWVNSPSRARIPKQIRYTHTQAKRRGRKRERERKREKAVKSIQMRSFV